MGTKNFFLGTQIDFEAASIVSDNADGDDINPLRFPDDEDGVIFSTNPLLAGQTANIIVEVNISGRLDAWIDFNRDGDWSDLGEQIFLTRVLTQGRNLLSFPVPGTAVAGLTFARFRLSQEGGQKAEGTVNVFGEVEDYQIEISVPEFRGDFGDAPDKYPVVLAQDGARHTIGDGVWLGKTVDIEPDGQPSTDAVGDDKNPATAPSDEDGVLFLSPIEPGLTARVEVTAAIGQLILDAWVDFNQNSVWEAGEKIFNSISLTPGANVLDFPVPATSVPGQTFARFRVGLKGGLQPTGFGDVGEVEDYSVTIEQEQFDFGDAPTQYPVVLAQDGARHLIVQGVFLGNTVDAERDGQPSAAATGDDATAGIPDDEDGISFVTNPLLAGSPAQVQVTASTGQGRLDAWIDFNRNGSWSDPGEQIFTSIPINTGVNTLTFNVPAGATLDLLFARFRFSFQGGLGPTGLASSGEVEDHTVRVARQPLDYGDAPQSFPVAFAQDGARHTQRDRFFLGQRVDIESDGTASASANADDAIPSTADDEDGVQFVGGSLTAGQAGTVQVISIVAGGRLDAWIDFNRDGDWADTGEKVFNNIVLAAGTNSLTVSTPLSAVPGEAFARFRLSEQGGLGVTGNGGNGEVEDHSVRIQAQETDFGDAPQIYPVMLTQDGARHQIGSGITLGRIVDPEQDGQPSSGASADDANPAAADDEDGIRFLTEPLVPGSPGLVEVFSSREGARLDAWIDFAADGDWDDTNDQIFASQVLNLGTNILNFTVPPETQSGASFSRFRLSLRGGLKPRGPAPDGEVEDHPVRMTSQQLDFGDAARTYPVLLSQDGARHRILAGFFLGKVIDAEPDGLPSALADGDDITPAGVPDDEDGVRFIGPLLVGATSVVEVVVSQTGILDAWIDFNQNFGWNEAGEQIFTSRTITTGTNILTFFVPSNAVLSDRIYARFRLSRQGGLKPVGLAPDGEVEDYVVTISQRPQDPCTPRTHRGTNFWVTFPGNYAPDPDNPKRIRLYIVGPRETQGTVSIPGLSYTTNFVILGTQEKIIELPTNAELGDVIDVVERKGINVTANNEVAVYGMNKVRWTTDGYLGLPSDVIGRRYVIQGFGNEFIGVPDLSGTQFAIVATEDATSVSITPRVATAGHPAGIAYSITLNRGETYQLRNTNSFNNDLTGTFINADKPISVFGGHQVTTVPSNDLFFADHLVEQLLPVERAGSFFIATPLATRQRYVVRIAAAQNSTPVVRNGVNIGFLNAGQFFERVETNAVLITSPGGLFVSQYAPSSDMDGVQNSDPFMAVITPIGMWLNQYLVTAPDLGFVDHYINITVPTPSVGTVLLDGVAVPAAQFAPVPTVGFSYARVKVTPGVHSLSAGVSFSAMVYGWAEYESYGFPAGMFFGDTEPPQLTCPEGTSVTLGSVAGAAPCVAIVPDFRQGVRVTDNCGMPSAIRIEQSPPPGSTVGPGLHFITLTSYDARGIPGYCQVPFNVIDPSPLELICPKNLFVQCTTNGGAYVNFEVLARRNCGPTEAEVSCVPASGSFFPEGTTTVTCSALDRDDRIVTCTFQVTVRCSGGGTITAVRDLSSNRITLSWAENAVLEQAPSITGPWTAVPAVQGSYSVTPTGLKAFFRLRMVE